ncbi:MAG TPA: extracellular solute-binding protein, partial [Clostridia bacterium]|nr:extracellular solute-binding protein [Clostridia bacterium]
LRAYLENAPNILQYTDEVALLYVTNDDGSITAIPRASLNRGDGFMIRQDWLDALGIAKVPRDVEGFVDMLYRFAKDDPDGNGLDDTYAWTDNEDGYAIVSYFARAYGADFGWQVDENGDLYHSRYRGDGFKKGLEIARQLMADGVIDPEMLVNKTARGKFLNGRIAIRGEYVGWLPRDRDALKANVPEARVSYAYPPANVKTGKTEALNTTVMGVWWIYGVTASCKAPQKVVDFFDWCLSDEGWPLLVDGIEGIHYTVDVNGVHTYTEAFRQYNTWRNFFAFMRRPDMDFYVSKALSPEDAKLVTETLECAVSVNVTQKHIGHRVPYQDELARGDWENREIKAVMDILYGDKPVDSWDEFVAEYRAGGFDIVEQQMDEWYHAFTGK